MADNPTIGNFSVLDAGGLIVRVAVNYITSDLKTHISSDYGEIKWEGDSLTFNPGSKKQDPPIENNTELWLHVGVKDAVADPHGQNAAEHFNYKDGAPGTANYQVHGTTFKWGLKFVGVTGID